MTQAYTSYYVWLGYIHVIVWILPCIHILLCKPVPWLALCIIIHRFYWARDTKTKVNSNGNAFGLWPIDLSDYMMDTIGCRHYEQIITIEQGVWKQI